MAKVDWDQSTVPDARAPFEALPKGKYPCIINSIEQKETKRGDGSYFEVECEVVKGDFKGRKVWARLNVNNPSEVAQNIGRAQFKQLCEAAGKPGAKTTEVLHGKYVVCSVSIERNDRGEANRVDEFVSPEKFKEAGGAAPTKEAQKGAKAGKGVDEDDIPF
jgi:Protein of unknown function (DUF669)